MKSLIRVLHLSSSISPNCLPFRGCALLQPSHSSKTQGEEKERAMSAGKKSEPQRWKPLFAGKHGWSVLVGVKWSVWKIYWTSSLIMDLKTRFCPAVCSIRAAKLCSFIFFATPNSWAMFYQRIKKCHGNSSSILLACRLCLQSFWLISGLEPAEYPLEIVTSEKLLTHQWNTLILWFPCLCNTNNKVV